MARHRNVWPVYKYCVVMVCDAADIGGSLKPSELK